MYIPGKGWVSFCCPVSTLSINSETSNEHYGILLQKIEVDRTNEPTIQWFEPTWP